MKGVRQGCSLSPQLFNLTVNSVLKSMDWDAHGYNINGQSISWLAYADDIVLISPSQQGLASMLDVLVRESTLVGLQLNFDKTLAMTNQRTTQPKNPSTLILLSCCRNIHFFSKFFSPLLE